jgi:1-acyl-sn-glycerol-3-phosphate acyltransferase
MAEKKSALAAGAARAKGERAKRTSTPLIGAEPVQVAPATTHRPTPVISSAPSKKAARQSGERTRVPRLSPRAKRLADERAGSRAHLTLASSSELPPADHESYAADAFRPSASPATTASPATPASPAASAQSAPTSGPATAAKASASSSPGGSLLGALSALPLPDPSAAVGSLVALLRTAAHAAGVAPEDIEQGVAAALAFLRRRIDGDYRVDDFGYDQDFTESVFYPLLRPIYQKWFRVEVRGIENIPDEGGALVVSNHSGTVAIDSLMLQLAIHDEHPRHRAMRALGADLVFQTPFLGTVARKAGSTLATNADAEGLFARGELVGVFPEGFKGVGKPFKDRYKLQRFGRGGFVATALKAQVPIIPVAIVGAEEIAPIIGNMTTVARLFGLPYAPITPTFPLLGPLGLIPLPSKWIIAVGEPIHTESYGPEAADDPMLVFDLTDQVRETIQQSLHEVLVTRRSVFF